MSDILMRNPLGAHLPAGTSLLKGYDSEGQLIQYGGTVREFRANAAITRGQALMWVAPTATVPVSVTPMTTAGDPRLFAGIAVHAAAAGAAVQVCQEGHALLFVNAQTVAFGDTILVPGTNTGEASCSSTDPDATVIVGRVIGVVMGIKDSANLCSVMVQPK